MRPSVTQETVTTVGSAKMLQVHRRSLFLRGKFAGSHEIGILYCHFHQYTDHYYASRTLKRSVKLQ